MRTVKSLLLIGLLTLTVFAVIGCVMRDAYYFVLPEGQPEDAVLAKPYHLTELRKSTAADVLPNMYMPEYILLSQSEKVLAAQGEKRKGTKKFYTMVTFDENDLLAKRKYLGIVDERPRKISLEPWTGLRFDCQMVIEAEVSETPYSDENARRVAMLKFVRRMTNDDMIEVIEDNKEYEIFKAMINQSLEAVLGDLEESPALAARISDADGLEFQHLSFNKGKIQMTDDEKVVTVKMRLGSFIRGFEKVEDVNYPPELEEDI